MDFSNCCIEYFYNSFSDVKMYNTATRSSYGMPSAHAPVQNLNKLPSTIKLSVGFIFDPATNISPISNISQRIKQKWRFSQKLFS